MKKIFLLYIKYTIVLIIFIQFLLCSAYCFSKYTSSDLSSNLLRLHVVANSNSVEDQNLKLKVRDSIINYINSISINSSSKKDMIQKLSNHKNDIVRIANEIIAENGYNYNVGVEIINSNFPTKNYGSIYLPNGNYDALNINIGSAQGQNWWCVLFPPLCFVDTSSPTFSDESYELLQNSLSSENFSIINKDSSTSEIKFKIVEIINNFTSNYHSN